ncbi:MAG TPA: aminotransferase class V-fold PLP-dependent enzyme [Candidatus Bathyarchaeota archaeon]|nr:aminotransferase class V-fold PLP-dependent enzyme [Candidatus Bathyarchaeota archaeon]
MEKYIYESLNFGVFSLEWNEGGKPFFAELIGASKDEISLIENTSMGLNIVANMLEYPREANIVTTDLEYPSVTYPYLKRKWNLEVRYVKNVDGKVLLEDVEKAVDDNTVVVAVSHVEYVNGFRNDLKALAEIAHKHGAFLVVDAIQSAGAIPIDVKRDDVDFLAAACYKWLLGPCGAGYLYVKRSLIKEFEPPLIGWASVKPEVFETVDFWDIWHLDFPEDASKFQVGSPSFISFLGATESIKLLLEVGIDKIEKRILGLTSLLIEKAKGLGLELQTPEEREHRSGIVNFKIDRASERVEKLSEKNFVVSARSHGIRVSPHFYNTTEEINSFIEALKET